MSYKTFDGPDARHAQRIRPACIKEGSLYWLLSRYKELLFPAWLFVGFKGSSMWGRAAWPPAILMTLLVLRFSEEGMSRRASVRQANRDLAWRAALGVPVDVNVPDEKTLREFEQFLEQAHPTMGRARYELAHEHLVGLCLKAGVVDSQNANWGADGTNMFCYGAVSDAIDLMGRGLLKLSRTWARATRQTSAQAARELELGWLFDAKSIKGAFSIDWRDKTQKAQVVTRLAQNCMRCAQYVREHLATTRRGLRKTLLRSAKAILKVVRLDLEPRSDGLLQITQKTARERLVSITDLQARHGRKSHNKPFNGFKLAILGELVSGLIVAVSVIAGNKDESHVAVRLIRRAKALHQDFKQLLADSAYGAMRIRVEASGCSDVEVVAPPPRLNRARAQKAFGKHDFDVDFETMVATCPDEHESSHWRFVKTSDGGVAPRFYWPRDGCAECALADECPSYKGRHQITLHTYEQLLRQVRADWELPKVRELYKKRCEYERLVHQMTRHGARRARAWGIAYARKQAHTIAMRCNLSLLARKLAELDEHEIIQILSFPADS